MLGPSVSPTTGLGTIGAIGALLSALAYALSAITVRILTRTDTTVSMVFWFLVLVTVFSGALSAASWVPVRGPDWLWIVALGALGAVGQHFITEAFRHAPASVIAPFEYTALLWGVLLDLVVWTVLPGVITLAGGAVVIGAGLYLIARERVHPRPVSKAFRDSLCESKDDRVRIGHRGDPDRGSWSAGTGSILTAGGPASPFAPRAARAS